MLRGIREMLRTGPEVLPQNRIKQRQKPTLKPKEWNNSIKEEEVTSINRHIFDFFITEGHYDLAKAFAEEAKLNVTIVDQKQIQQRSLIKNLIRNNKIDEAILKIQQFGITKKDQDRQTQLIFTLKCLKVIDLIKQQKIEESIQTAKTELIPYVKKKFDWMQKVEKVMSLIAFIDVKECQNYELTTNHYKNKVADDVNTYLLQNNSDQSLKILINLGKWCEKKLQAYVNFPHVNPWAHDIYQP